MVLHIRNNSVITVSEANKIIGVEMPQLWPLLLLAVSLLLTLVLMMIAIITDKSKKEEYNRNKGRIFRI